MPEPVPSRQSALRGQVALGEKDLPVDRVQLARVPVQPRRPLRDGPVERGVEGRAGRREAIDGMGHGVQRQAAAGKLAELIQILLVGAGGIGERERQQRRVRQPRQRHGKGARLGLPVPESRIVESREEVVAVVGRVVHT